MIRPGDGLHKASRLSSNRRRRGMDSLLGDTVPRPRRMLKLRLPRMARNPRDQMLMEHRRRDTEPRHPRAMAHLRGMELRVRLQVGTELHQRMERHRQDMALHRHQGTTEEAMDSLSSTRRSRHTQRQAAQVFLPGQIRKL